MSAISVSNESQLAAAARSAVAGDTIQLQPGIYPASEIQVADGVAVDGGGLATLIAPDGKSAFLARAGQYRMHIQGIQCIGGLLRFAGDAKNISVSKCNVSKFDKSFGTPSGGGTAIGGWVAVDGLDVKDSTFTDSPNGRAISIRRMKNTTIGYNLFRGVFLGIKSKNTDSANDLWPSTQLVIFWNEFDGCRYHSVELQGVANGVYFNDNYIHGYTVSQYSENMASTFGASIIFTTPSFNQFIRRNKFMGPGVFTDVLKNPGPPAPRHAGNRGVPLGVEFGENTVCEDNYFGSENPNDVRGFWETYHGYDGKVGGSQFRNNRVSGFKQGLGYFYPSGAAKPSVQENNTPTTQLSWDINRGGYGPRTGTVPPIIIPPSPPANEWKPTLTVTGEHTATLTWPIMGSVGYDVQTKTTKGGDPWVSLGHVPTNTANIIGLHSGWEIDYRVVAGLQVSASVTDRQTGDSTAGPDHAPKIDLTLPPAKPRKVIRVETLSSRVYYDDETSEVLP
jgi:hypothetical protein